MEGSIGRLALKDFSQMRRFVTGCNNRQQFDSISANCIVNGHHTFWRMMDRSSHLEGKHDENNDMQRYGRSVRAVF